MNKIETVKPVHGICHMIVCSTKEATDKEILDFCNKDNPSGTTLGWATVIRNDKKHPQCNPLVCNDNKDRLHFMVGC